MTPDQRLVPAPGSTAVPRPSLPGPPPGAVAAIDAALVGLDGLDELSLPEHVARFDAVHAALTDALSSIDRV